MQPTQQLRDIIAAYRTTYTRRSMARRAPTRAERDVLDLCTIVEGMADSVDGVYDAIQFAMRCNIRARLAEIVSKYVTPSAVFGNADANRKETDR